MTKPEAQIEFLRTLRTWCPFYGALMFEVDCQYDYAPTDSGTIPPVIHLTAAVGSKGIYLISNTKSNERTIMLHSYSKILKYKAYSDQNIFIYWVLKRTVDPSLVYEAAMQDGEAFNPDIYCDKVYIVADSCSEIEFLVQSYVAIETDCKRPLLPGVSERYLRAEGLLKEKELDYPTVSVVTESEPLNITDTSMRKELVAEAVEDAFFQGSLAKSIEKEGYHSDSHLYGDDAVGVETSVFRDLYASLAHSAAAVANGTRERTSIEDNMQAPPTVKLAVTMEDLQHKQASGIYNFSDNEEATEELEVQSEDDAAGSSSCRYSLSESSDEAVATVMPPGIADKLADTSLPASGRFSRLFKWG